MVHLSVDIGTSSTRILDANAERNYTILINDSDTVIYIGLGHVALLNYGLRLEANGGRHEFTGDHIWRGYIDGIHGAAGTKKLIGVAFGL